VRSATASERCSGGRRSRSALYGRNAARSEHEPGEAPDDLGGRRFRRASGRTADRKNCAYSSSPNPAKPGDGSGEAGRSPPPGPVHTTATIESGRRPVASIQLAATHRSVTTAAREQLQQHRPAVCAASALLCPRSLCSCDGSLSPAGGRRPLGDRARDLCQQILVRVDVAVRRAHVDAQRHREIADRGSVVAALRKQPGGLGGSRSLVDVDGLSPILPIGRIDRRSNGTGLRPGWRGGT
jgi:hypothetical protein